MKSTVALFWFRRDLRLEDNAGLYHALKENESVLPVFIFDRTILDKLENKNDRRVDFIHQALMRLQHKLNALESSLHCVYNTPLKAFTEFCAIYRVTKVYANGDYEPQAQERDKEIERFLSSKKIPLFIYKDQCIFEKNEVVKDDGLPYTVFTPYSRKWKKALTPVHYTSYPANKHFSSFIKITPLLIPSLEEIGFRKTDLIFVAPDLPDTALLRHYSQQRDYPSVKGTSRLSIHLRFGTISIRALVKHAINQSETWLNELIWRDFYMMILWHFPHVVSASFKKEYDRIEWRNNEAEFRKWCEGDTGFPIVDAGMRELNTTGYMHNRVRMIVSSFLIKDLLIDWRWGEAYFAQKLNDFDLSANNGGWQWASSGGCDAAPYFRIFNPTEQQKKFDPEFKYIKKWVPEYGTQNYPMPMVDHGASRNRALAVYKKALNGSNQVTLFD